MLSLLGASLLVTVIFTVTLYNVQVNATIEKVESRAEAVSQPLLMLASRGVAGGNLMKLKNDDARALYEASGALYLHFSGMSDGSAATSFMAAIPSQTMDFEFVAEGFSTLNAMGNTDSGGSTTLLPEQGLYVVKKSLDIRNGGSFTAVFPAHELKTVTARVMRNILPIGFAVMLISVVISLIVGSLLTRPINRMVDQISRMAQDLDLTPLMSHSNIREIDSINGSLTRFLEKMRETLQRVRTLGNDIFAANAKVEGVVGDNERELMTQQRQLEFLSSSIMEMSVSVRQVAQNAAATADEAKGSSELVEHGKHIVASTVQEIHNLEQGLVSTNTLIQELNESTRQIGRVLDVIGGIAEQTNLLALNAAIEAARAGEQGRGFAVVADEVRALASKTKESTGEVNAIIARLQNAAHDTVVSMEKEVHRAEASARQAEEANHVLVRIQTAINNMQGMTRQTAINTGEQAGVSDSISRSVNELNDLSGYAVQHIGNTREAVSDVESRLAHINAVIQQFRL